jgi:hypothetical protein
MLTVVRTHWFSRGLTVSDGSRVVATIDMARWRERGVLTVQGVTCRLFRERPRGGDFILESSGTTLARARKPSAFRRTFIIDHAGRRYVLRARAAFRRAFVLVEGDREVGSVSPASLFARGASAELPVEMPLPVKAFLIWLVVISWRRAARAAAAAG